MPVSNFTSWNFTICLSPIPRPEIAMGPIPRPEIVTGTRQGPTVLRSWELGTGLVRASACGIQFATSGKRGATPVYSLAEKVSTTQPLVFNTRLVLFCQLQLFLAGVPVHSGLPDWNVKFFTENLYANFEVHLQCGCESLIFYCRMGGVEHLEWVQ